MAKKNNSNEKKDFSNIEDLNKYLNKIINDMLTNNTEIKSAFENTPFQYGISIKFNGNGQPMVEGLSSKAAQQDQIKKISEDPMFDIFERGDQILVDIALPGVAANDIKIESTPSSVHIMASNGIRHYDKKIDLPKNVDPASAKALFNNNVLEITFNKAGDQGALSIEVK
ncbi:MAG: Hsp20/alpha crystallin family protein [Candidatus Micrarchaeaceae archaeon]